MATSGGAGPQEAALKIVGEADDEAARTYIFWRRGPHLGNALRHVLMRQKDVEFCGYSVPHPPEPFVHVRLQTTARRRATCSTTGLKQLGGICDARAAQLDKAGGLAETRKRSDCRGPLFRARGALWKRAATGRPPRQMRMAPYARRWRRVDGASF